MNDISEMPQWLLEKLRDKPALAAWSPASLSVNVTPTRYGPSVLESELTKLRDTPEGGRNDQLNRSAFVAGQLVAGGQIDAQEAWENLHEAALSKGLPPDEIERTLASGWGAGSAQPRGPKLANTPLPSRPATVSARVLAEMTFPELQWAIPKILPEGLTMLAGKPKLGKSYLCLQMALAGATGDCKVFGVGGIEPADVLVCALEDSPRRLHDRIHQMYPFGGAPDRLHFATGWPRLDQGGIEELDAWCDDHPGARAGVSDHQTADAREWNPRGGLCPRRAGQIRCTTAFLRPARGRRRARVRQ